MKFNSVKHAIDRKTNNDNNNNEQKKNSKINKSFSLCLSIFSLLIVLLPFSAESISCSMNIYPKQCHSIYYLYINVNVSNIAHFFAHFKLTFYMWVCAFLIAVESCLSNVKIIYLLSKINDSNNNKNRNYSDFLWQFRQMCALFSICGWAFVKF